MSAAVTLAPRFDLDAWSRDVEYLTREYRNERANELTREGRARRDGWKTWVGAKRGEAPTPPTSTEHGAMVDYAERIARAAGGELADARVRAGGHEATHAKTGPDCELPPDFPKLEHALPSAFQGKGEWHFCRARALRERFERVASCQKEETVEIACDNCGHKVTHGARCRVILVCTSCRGKVGVEKKAKLALNRRRAIDLAWKAGRLMKFVRGGRWSEKLATLTLPDTPELDAAARIRLQFYALRFFSSGMNAWIEAHAGRFRDRQGRCLARWFRNVEWTPGHAPGCPAKTDDKVPCRCSGRPGGHPHAHLWMLGPYLRGGAKTDDPRTNVLRNLWREALRRAAHVKEDKALVFPELAQRIGPGKLGKLSKKELVERVPAWFWNPDIHGLDELIVDVRACRPGKKSLEEVVKYLFKDTVSGGRKLAPENWATVYEGYEGRRTTQGSRGLMSLDARERALDGYLVDDKTGELTPIPFPLDLRLFQDLRGPGCPCPRCRHVGRYAQGRWVSIWTRTRRPMSEAERTALAARKPLAKSKTSIGLPFASLEAEAIS